MIKWSVKHKNIVALLSLIILAFGFYLYIDMERKENPIIESPIATIQCIYPGASPEDIEKLVVKPIEDKVNEMSEISHIQSYCIDSCGIIKVKLKDLSDAEVKAAWEDMKDKVDSVKADLPSDAQEPVVETDFTSCYGDVIALYSDDYTYEDLKAAAKKLQNELKDIDGIEAVDIEGQVDDEIDINLDLQKMQQYNISATDVGTYLAARNVNIPGGNLELGQIKIPVQVSGEYADIEEIKNTIINVSKDNGTTVYLKDIATVEKANEKKDVMASVNNKKALLIGVKFMQGQNVLNINKNLQSAIENFKTNELYAKMNMIQLTNEADFVADSINLFEDNLISAVVLVLVVVLVTMGLRSAVIVSVPIPLIMAIVFISMKLMDIPLHQVSIASLIISLSLLVANGIVANDSMYLYLENGADRMTACTKGIDEVKISILTSTLTTVASFLPLAMMQGSAGKFVKSLPILVCITLVASFFTSLTVVPAMGHKFLKITEKGENNFKAKIVRALKLDIVGDKLSAGYGKILNLGLKAPRLLLLIFIGLFAASLFVIPTLDVQLFPPVERDQYLINMTIKDGSTTEQTYNKALEVGKILEKDKNIKNYSFKAGDGYMKYYTTFAPQSQASNKAQFMVNGPQSDIKKIQQQIEAEVPGVVINMQKLEIGIPADYPIEIRVSGDDTAELTKIAEDIKEKIRDIEGTQNIENNYGDESYKLKVDVNEEKANMVGVTNYDIAKTVRMVVNGLEITKLKQKDIEADTLPIVMRISDSDKSKKEILDKVYVTSQATNANVPLSQIAEINTESSLNRIVRRNGKRTISIGSYIQDGYNTNNVLKLVQEKLSNYKMPDGYTMEIGGEKEEQSSTFTSLVVPSILAVVVIYLILVFQFKHLREPLIIMGTIPLSFIGVIWGLKITGYPIGFMALLGAISLMGVVVNNGIVLLDYIKLQTDKYDSLNEAIVEACKTRIRPIMIGMVTTVISLIPLAVSGGKLWAPMANAIIFGMLISSILTLLVIPCCYLLIQGQRAREEKLMIKLRNRSKRESEEEIVEVKEIEDSSEDEMEEDIENIKTEDENTHKERDSKKED